MNLFNIVTHVMLHVFIKKKIKNYLNLEKP